MIDAGEAERCGTAIGIARETVPGNVITTGRTRLDLRLIANGDVLAATTESTGTALDEGGCAWGVRANDLVGVLKGGR